MRRRGAWGIFSAGGSGRGGRGGNLAVREKEGKGDGNVDRNSKRKSWLW